VKTRGIAFELAGERTDGLLPTFYPREHVPFHEDLVIGRSPSWRI
jgi:hypothetical protein